VAGAAIRCLVKTDSPTLACADTAIRDRSSSLLRLLDFLRSVRLDM